jgi:hypothetical protein
MSTQTVAGAASRAAKYVMFVTAWRARRTAATAAATNEPGSSGLPRSEVWLREMQRGAAVGPVVFRVALVRFMLPWLPTCCCGIHVAVPSWARGGVGHPPTESRDGRGDDQRT